MKKKLLKFVFTKALKWVLPAVVVIFLVYRTIDFATGSWECRVHWTESGMDYKYKIGAGCMIKPDQFWIPAKNYRID